MLNINRQMQATVGIYKPLPQSSLLDDGRIGALSVCLVIGVALACGAFTVPHSNAAMLPGVSSSNNGKVATEITADGSLEWHQDKNLYVARVNARAVHGDLTVEADVLAAHKRDKTSDGTGKNDIDRFIADGNVRIISADQQAFGEHAVYDVDHGVMQLTGQGLKYVSGNGTVTARDSLEYYEEKGMAVARGDAVAVQDDKRITGDVMTVLFRPAVAGKSGMEPEQMTAEGNVVVTTVEGVSRGDHAVYDPKRKVAVLSGRVRITSGGTQLAGDNAEVDFTTGVSRLTGKSSSGGRIRALLSPDASKKAKSSESKKP